MGNEANDIRVGSGSGEALWREGLVRLGDVQLAGRDLSCACAWGLCLAYVWLVFGYGYVDGPDTGQGYLSLGVLIAKAVSFLVAVLVVRFDTLFDRMSSSLASMALVGVVCAVSSFPLVTALQFTTSDGVLWALSAVSTASATLCCVAGGRACMRCGTARQFMVVMMLALLVCSLCYFLILTIGGVFAAALFSLLPGAATCLVVGLNRPDASVDVGEEAATWQAEASERFTPAQATSMFGRLVVTVLAFVLLIAFVRSMGLGFKDDRAGHEVGSSLGMAFLALLALVVLVLFARGLRRTLAREFYVASCAVICLAALVMVLTSTNNPAVRAVEDIAYFLLAFSVLYAITAAVRLRGVPGHLALSLGLAAASLGVALGWGLQNALVWLGRPEDDFTVVLLALTLLAFVCFMTVFPHPLYGRFVGDRVVALGVGAGDAAQAAPVDQPRINIASAAVEPVAAVSAAPGAGERVALEEAGEAAPAEDAADTVGEEAGTGAHERRSHITFKEAADLVATECLLSKRERDVLLLLIKGWSDQRIADELFVSYNTVRAHIRHIYTKADVHNREELLDLIGAAQNERR